MSSELDLTLHDVMKNKPNRKIVAIIRFDSVLAIKSIRIVVEPSFTLQFILLNVVLLVQNSINPSKKLIHPS